MLTPQNRSRLISKINQIDNPICDLRNRVVHQMANLSKVDMEKEVQKHLGSRDSLTALIKKMQNLLIEFGEQPTENGRLLYDGINDFVLEALQSKAD